MSIHAQRFAWLVAFGACIVAMTYATHFPGWILAVALLLGVAGGVVLRRQVDRGR